MRRGDVTTSRTRGREQRRERRQCDERRMRWQGTRRREERQCNNQPDKKGESGRTRGDGTARGGGTGRGHKGVRRGNTTTSQTRGARAEERRRNNQLDKRRERGRTRGNGAARGRDAGRGRDGMRRGDTITSQTRGMRAEE